VCFPWFSVFGRVERGGALGGLCFSTGRRFWAVCHRVHKRLGEHRTRTVGQKLNVHVSDVCRFRARWFPRLSCACAAATCYFTAVLWESFAFDISGPAPGVEGNCRPSSSVSAGAAVQEFLNTIWDRPHIFSPNTLHTSREVPICSVCCAGVYFGIECVLERVFRSTRKYGESRRSLLSPATELRQWFCLFRCFYLQNWAKR